MGLTRDFQEGFRGLVGFPPQSVVIDSRDGFSSAKRERQFIMNYYGHRDRDEYMADPTNNGEFEIPPVKKLEEVLRNGYDHDLNKYTTLKFSEVPAFQDSIAKNF